MPVAIVGAGPNAIATSKTQREPLVLHEHEPRVPQSQFRTLDLAREAGFSPETPGLRAVKAGGAR